MAKTPTKKKPAAKTKPAVKKAAVKKTAAKQPTAKKPAVKKTAAKTTSTRKTSTRKTSTRKTTAKKSVAKKTPAKKTVARKTASKKITSSKVDLTLIVNAHAEGAILIPTLKSAHMAVEKARRAGLSVEFILLADNPDTETLNISNKLAPKYGYDVKIAKVKDLGLARNTGLGHAKGEILAFMDGDDLMSENWLLQGYRVAKNLGPKVILHPEMNYVFGNGQTYIYLHRDMDDPAFDMRVLLLQNYWTALSIGHRETYASFPYEPNTMDSGWGYEDWGWNLLTISNGIKHKTVPNTAHYIRKKKSGSLLETTLANNCLPRLSPLRLKVLSDVVDRAGDAPKAEVEAAS